MASMRVAALAVLAGLMLPAMVHAEAIGPVCWRLEETYRLFFILDPANPAVAAVAGEALAGGGGDPVRSLPLSGSAIKSVAPTAVTDTVSVLLTVWSGFQGGSPYFVRANFNLADLSGQAVCQLASGAPSGCDQGPFNWTPVVCP